jgi:hypothetical protein
MNTLENIQFDINKTTLRDLTPVEVLEVAGAIFVDGIVSTDGTGQTLDFTIGGPRC